MRSNYALYHGTMHLYCSVHNFKDLRSGGRMPLPAPLKCTPAFVNQQKFPELRYNVIKLREAKTILIMIIILCWVCICKHAEQNVITKSSIHCLDWNHVLLVQAKKKNNRTVSLVMITLYLNSIYTWYDKSHKIFAQTVKWRLTRQLDLHLIIIIIFFCGRGGRTTVKHQ